MARFGPIGVTHYGDDESNAYATAVQSVVGLTLAFWILRFFIVPFGFPSVKKTINQFYICNSIISSSHSSLQIFLVSYFINNGKLILWSDELPALFTNETTLEHRLICAITIGYFIHDTMAILYYEYYYLKKIDYLMIVHHIIGVLCLISTIKSEVGGQGIMQVCVLCLPYCVHIKSKLYIIMIFYNI